MRIVVYLDRQRLELIDGNAPARRPIRCRPRATARESATAANARRAGLHIVRAKVGGGLCSEHRVRRGGGRPESCGLRGSPPNHPARDWMLTRILWLSGRERVQPRRRTSTRCGARSTSTARVTRPALGAPALARLHPDEQRRRDRALRCRGHGHRSRDRGGWRAAIRGARGELERRTGAAARGAARGLHRRAERSRSSRWDAADVASRHALALDAQGAAVGCARLLPTAASAASRCAAAGAGAAWAARCCCVSWTLRATRASGGWC